MVPNGWKQATLESLCVDPITYGVLKPGIFSEGGTPLLQIKDLLGDMDNLEQVHRISEELDFEYRRSKIKTNDILISLVGTVGRIGIVPPNLNNANIHRNIGRIRTKNYEYLVHYLKSDIAKNKIGLSSSGSSQSALNLSVLRALKVPVPPFPEQRKIAQILSTWDKAITTTEKLIDVSKQQKKALMQQLLTGKKRLVDPETGMAFEGEWRKSKTPYESLPSDWSELALEKLSSFITKGATPTTYGFEWQEYGIPFLRSECVGKNGFKESGLNYICDAAHEAMARSKVYAGDILITITGNVGRVCRLPNKYPQANINQHIAKVTLKDENVCSDFIFHCLQDNKYQSNFERITTGQAYPQISLVQVRSTIVPLPPISEQQKIASVLIAADKEIELLEAKLAHLKQEKKALMQQLLTGKRRVQVEAA